MRARGIVPAGAIIALVLALTAESRASIRPFVDSASGRVEFPAASPTPGRLVYLTTELNGQLAYVIDLGRRIDDRTPYTLTRTSSLTPVDLDVWFYSDLYGSHGEGYPCGPTGPSGGPPEPDGDGGETGIINCGDSNADGMIKGVDRARYAVVYLFTGARASFRLTW